MAALISILGQFIERRLLFAAHLPYLLFSVNLKIACPGLGPMLPPISRPVIYLFTLHPLLLPVYITICIIQYYNHLLKLKGADRGPRGPRLSNFRRTKTSAFLTNTGSRFVILVLDSSGSISLRFFLH